MDVLAAAAAAASTLSSGGDAASSGAAAAALFAAYTGDGGGIEALLRSLEPAQLAALLVHLVHLGAKTRAESEELLRGAGGQGRDLVAAVRAALIAEAAARRAPHGRAVDAGDCGALPREGAACPQRAAAAAEPPPDDADARIIAAARAALHAREEADALDRVAVADARAAAAALNAHADALRDLKFSLIARMNFRPSGGAPSL